METSRRSLLKNALGLIGLIILDPKASYPYELKQITDKTLEEEIKSSKLPLLIDFYADWCPPCKKLEPHFKEIAQEYGDKINFGRLNTDFNKESKKKYRIQWIPTLLYFKNGEEKGRHVGYLEKEKLKEKIEEWLK